MSLGLIKTKDTYDIATFNALQSAVGTGTNNVRTGIGVVRAVKNTQGKLCGYVLHNNNAAVRWVQFYFRPASEVIVGTTAPDFTVMIGSSGTVQTTFDEPILATTGLSVSSTTTEVGTGAVVVDTTGSILYK
jgi:hypothetical protein